jgi:hypothetical protein
MINARPREGGFGKGDEPFKTKKTGIHEKALLPASYKYSKNS